MIEGLTALTTGAISRNLGGTKFALPASFDSSIYASKWVENGPEIEEARQEQVLSFAGVSAQGWEVFKTIDTENAKKDDKVPKLVPVMRSSGKRQFVLMFRPIALQRAVNKLYADQSRDMVNREISGEQASVNEANDPGILTNADLQRVQRTHGEDAPTAIPKSSSGITQPNRASELALQ